MTAIDNVLGMDWLNATYLGDGVYLRDASDYMGIPALAIRTDRESDHHVIVFEADVFDTLVRRGQAILTANALAREALTEGGAKVTYDFETVNRCHYCGWRGDKERSLVPLSIRWEGDYGYAYGCRFGCSNHRRPYLDDLLRSKAAWMQGFGGPGYTAHLPVNFSHRGDAVRCELCGRPCGYVPGHNGQKYWPAFCQGAGCPSLPRPEVPA